MLLEQQNYKAFEYARQTAFNIDAVCKPLIEYTDINLFLYFRLYDNGRYIHTGNQLNYLEFYFLTVPNNGDFFTRELVQAVDDDYHCFLWQDLPKSNDPVISAINKFNICNGVSMYKRGQNYIESWHFADTRGQTDISSYYTAHKKMFMAFIDYFILAAQDLITLDDNHANLAYYQQNIDISRPKNPLSVDQCQAFYNAIQYSSYKHKGIILSPREQQCMRYLTQGCSAKEIGKKLSLSHRTVEFYISSMLKKMGLKKSIHLIKHY